MEYLISIVVYAGAVGFLLMIIARQRNAKLKLFQKAFDSAFGGRVSKPKYEIGFSYGITNFTITFSSKEDLEQSKTDGSIELFSRIIAELCKNERSRGIPFDPDRAIYFTYEGKWDEGKLESVVLYSRDDNNE